MKNIKEDVFALKSLMKEIEKDLKDQMKVEDKVPEGKTDSLKDLLEFTKDEMKKRPTTSKPGKVEKGKKSSKKDIKKSIEELKSLINEINVVKSEQGIVNVKSDTQKSEVSTPTTPVDKPTNPGEDLGDALLEFRALGEEEAAKREASAGQSPDAREEDDGIPKEDYPF